MATVQSIVYRVFREVGVYNQSQTPSPDELVGAIDDLNDILSALHNDGVKISSGGLTAGDTFPEDGSEAMAVRYLLGVQISFTYRRVMPTEWHQRGEALVNSLRSKYAEVPKTEHDLALTVTYGG